MNVIGRAIICTLFLFTCFSNAHAVSVFGAMTYGSYLDDASLNLISFEDGGVGSLNADIDDSPNLRAFASFDGPTFTPILKAKSESSGASSDDAFTQSEAAAYQTFQNTGLDPLDVSLKFILSATVSTLGTSLSNSFVLADIYAIGGPNYDVTASSGDCASGTSNVPMFLGKAYMCGQRLDNRLNLFTNVDATIMDTLAFSVAPGDFFGIYGILRANSRDGSANAFDTLEFEFENDTTFIQASGMPQSVVPLPAAIWLFGAGLIGIFGFTHKKKYRQLS